MKKIKILVYSLLSSLAILSCRDAIDIVQPGEVTQEVAFQSVADLKSFLLGNVYTSVDTSNEIQLGSIITDETAITPQNSGWWFNEFRYGLMSDNGQVEGTWASHYNTINKVNRLLEAASKINPGSDVAKYNSILAEARTLRAFAYLQLTSYFTTNMKDDNALGVILTTTVPDVYDQLPRVNNGQIYAQIENDLNFASTNFVPLASTDPNYANRYKYVTIELINAIRARMYAYRGNYTLAKQYAQEVINASNPMTIATPYAASTFYNSPSTSPYKRIWQDAMQGEVIFALSRPSVGTWGNVASLWTTNTTSLTGTPLLGMSFNLYNIINTGSDIRRFAFVDPTSNANTLVIDKYSGKANTPLRNDIKVFRVSEMYLILAEAAAAENQLSTAATYIQQIRTARKYTAGAANLPVYNTQADAYKDILKERRAELCFEGHRYVDLRRLGALAGVSIDRNAQDDYFNPSTPLSIPITDHRFTFPIPQQERAGNPSIVQNPGY